MPLWLRKTTYHFIKEHYEKQKEATENQQNLLKNGDVLKPNITQSPTYTTKKSAQN